MVVVRVRINKDGNAFSCKIQVVITTSIIHNTNSCLEKMKNNKSMAYARCACRPSQQLQPDIPPTDNNGSHKS